MKKSFIFKVFAVVLAMVMGVCVFTACSGDEKEQDNEQETELQDSPAGEHTRVKFEIEIAGKDAGSFTMELYPEYAPITVEKTYVFILFISSFLYKGCNLSIKFLKRPVTLSK